jgi:23S rRNA (uracil1939-C5)-methyltransferase
MKLQIEKMINGGQGLARIPTEAGPQAGKRAFVPFTLPDEEIQAEVTEEHRGYCLAEARQIERASEYRVEAPCPWFGTCGGCQLQHAAYSYQLELKREILAETMHRAGLRELPDIELLAGAPFGYRNRIRFQVQFEPQFAIGYREAKSHRLVAIDRCPVAAPLLERCIAGIRVIGIEGNFPFGTRELELFTNHDESQLLITLWMGSAAEFTPNAAKEFFFKMRGQIPQLSGGIVLASETGKAQAGKTMLQWKRTALQYRAGGRDYIVSAGSFFQVNLTLIDTLISAVCHGKTGTVAWDLYAGVGLFSLQLTDSFRHVIAVESGPTAYSDLQKNLRGGNSELVKSPTLQFLQSASRQIAKKKKDAPDLIVLDPPRAGVGPEVCKLLGQCGAPLVVYVSCDPATLGRDLNLLIQSGYRLDRLQLVDLFPQTQHLETIATLRR